MSYYLEHKGGNLWLGKFSIFPENMVISAISTRLGGNGKKPYDSLNLALHVGDDSESVLKNRESFAQVLGLRADETVLAEQVHGDKVCCVTANMRGMGAKRVEDAVKGADALITKEQIPLMLCFADCVPLLFFDPRRLAVGIAHAGWRGTVKNIGANTIKAMEDAFGTDPKDILAAIGPSIGPCCYEIDEERANCFRENFPRWKERIIIKREDKLFLDLWETNRRSLVEAGVSEANIDMANVCTSHEHSWYFSYRKENPTGRIGALIALKNYGGGAI